MSSLLRVVVALFLFNYFIFPKVETISVKFKNIICNSYNTTFAIFSMCNLKVIKRNVVALNVYMKLNKLPISNIMVIINSKVEKLLL